MPKESLNEREFELINILGAELEVNQRELSRHMNLSLGMTNMLLRRMVTKGYIRIQQLNQRKVQYLLTPKGFVEKMSKSVKYTLKTINSIGLIKKQLREVLAQLYENGTRKFYILGESDLADVTEMVLKEYGEQGYQCFRMKSFGEIPSDGIILICKEDILAQGQPCVYLIEELAKLHVWEDKTDKVTEITQ